MVVQLMAAAAIASWVGGWADGYQTAVSEVNRGAFLHKVQASPAPGGAKAVGSTVGSGKVYEFNAGSPASGMLKSGWSAPEPWGTWSVGKAAAINIPVTAPSGKGVELIIEFSAFLAPPKLTSQTVVLEVNGVSGGSLKITDGSVIKKSIRIPAKSVGNALAISFKIDKPTSPESVGGSTDGRLLGVGITRITVQ